MKKSKLKKVVKKLIKNLDIKIDLEVDTSEEILELNKTIEAQKNIIAMLENQLRQQDKAIEYKDLQFLGLKSAYKDDLINSQI